MKFIMIFLITMMGAGRGDICEKTKNVPEVNSGVVCLSQTQFAFADYPEFILTCPQETVCADVAEICSATAPAVCDNVIIGAQGPCGSCRNENVTHTTCISSTEYAICSMNGVLLTSLTYTCPEEQFCKYDPTNPGVMCVTSEKGLKIDCPLNPGSGSGSGNETCDCKCEDGEPFRCTQPGLFPDPTDKECVKYYKCSLDVDGNFVKLHLQCITDDFLFNPAEQRCERNYQCIN